MRPAPEWSTTQWFGSDPLDLSSLRGRVVVLEITQPTKGPLATFQRVWFDRLIPLVGRFAGSGALEEGTTALANARVEDATLSFEALMNPQQAEPGAAQPTRAARARALCLIFSRCSRQRGRNSPSASYSRRPP